MTIHIGVSILLDNLKPLSKLSNFSPIFHVICYMTIASIIVKCILGVLIPIYLLKIKEGKEGKC